MRTRTAIGGLRFVALAATFSAALFSTAAHAQQPVLTIELPPIQVGPPPPSQPTPAQATGSANVVPKEVVVSPTALTTPSENIASSVTVITREELERTQRRTVAEALQTVPGLNVAQTGGPGGQTSVFMRGTEARH